MTLEIILWIISSALLLTSMLITVLILAADDKALSSFQRVIACIVLFWSCLLFIISFTQAISSMIELTIQQLK